MVYINFYTIVLFVAAAGVFIYRARVAKPKLRPYAVSVGGGLLAMFVAGYGAYFAAIVMFVAASFLLVYLAGEPFPEETD